MTLQNRIAEYMYEYGIDIADMGYPMEIAKTMAHFAAKKALRVARVLGRRYPYADPISDTWLMELLEEPIRRYGVYVDFVDLIDAFIEAANSRIEQTYWERLDALDLGMEY